MLSAYFDDSGTHRGAPVVVWGGLFGTVDQWDALNGQWRALLANPLPGKPPLKKFHLYDCEHGAGEFRDYSRAERDRLQYLFRSIIIENGLVGTTTGINRADWEQFVPKNIKDDLKDAETLALLNCIRESLFGGHASFPRETQVAITFDLGRESEWLVARAWSFVRMFHGPLRVVHIGFSPVVEFPPLQAADILATEAYWLAKEELRTGTVENMRPSLRHLIGNIAARGNIADRWSMLESLERYNHFRASRGLPPETLD